MNWLDPHFAEPRWLWLGLFAPLLLLLLQSYSAWARKKQLARFAAAPFIAELTRSHSPLRRNIKNALLLLAVAAIGLALARPQWGQRQEAAQTLGEDVVFILDCSRSMLAADVAPNRMQRAKLAILDFIHRHRHRRVGLVAFAGQAFLQCPLTFDYGAFEDALLAVDDKTIPIPGTDIASALDEGSHALEKGERNKFLILLTDGEDLEKGGVRMAERLGAQGVTIFTIGVGTPAGATIQVINDQGKQELLRDSRGEPVLSHLDEATLRGIAETTHGAYYPLGDLGEGLAKAGLALAKMNTNSHSAPARKLGIDRYYFPIAVVLLLVIAESLAGTRRAGYALKLIFLSCFFCFEAPAQQSAASDTSANPEAAPSTPRAIFNAGTRRLQEGKLPEAEALLQNALASQVPRLQPPALYNLGHVRFKQGLDELKKGPSASLAGARAKPAIQEANEAVRAADEALGSDQIEKLVAAYVRGRGARKELKAAREAVRQALEAHNNTLTKWQRASADFKSAIELNPSDAQARDNADVVDRSIARLVDSLRQLQQMSLGAGATGRQLSEKLKALKGRIPGSQMPPGGAGEEEEDDEDEFPFGIEPGQKEGPSKEGKEMTLSAEQAGWLLEGFKLGNGRRLPMGEGQSAQPRDRSRPTW